MNALYALLGMIGVVAAIMGVAWLGQRASRREGSASERADASADAREVEQDMTDEVMKPPDTQTRLDNGTF